MTNINRASRLLMGPCTDQLRDLLRFYIPPASFSLVIQRERLRLPRLTEPQRKLILPNSGVYSGNYDEMDISLLYILLRNVCGLQVHNKGWGNIPDSSDRSVSANIERFRLARNRCGHSTVGMSTTDFNPFWSEIRAAVVDLDKVLGLNYKEKVDFVRKDTMDPKMDQQYRDQLLDQMKEIVNITKTIDSLKSSHREMNERVLAIENSNILPSIKENEYKKDTFQQWKEEDKLFVPTKASEKIETLIENNNLVIVSGHSGSGKSTIIQHTGLEYLKRGWIVCPVDRVEEIKEIYETGKFTEKETIFIFNDPIGKESLDDILFTTWKTNEHMLTLFLKKVKMLLSCRTCVLDDARVRGLLKDNLISNLIVIDGTRCKLSNDEKRKIFKKHVPNEDTTKEELAEILQTETYFPLLCKLFAQKPYNSNNAINFFKEPFEVVKMEIENYRVAQKPKYCALVCLVLFNNKLCYDDLEVHVQLFERCLKICEISIHPNTILKQLDTLKGIFVKKIGGTYYFYHDFLMEVTTFVLGMDNPRETIRYADVSFLRKRIRLANTENKNEFTIYVEDEHIDVLVERFFKEIFEDRFIEVVLNPCLRNTNVIEHLKEKLKQNSVALQKSMIKRNMKLQLEESEQTVKRHFLSRLDFLMLGGNEISPLFALIVFCHSDLSSFCLKQLQHMETNLTLRDLFSAVCCNGKKNFIKLFDKKEIKGCFNEKWGILYPIHIASVFHNWELILPGMDVNARTDENDYWTPLQLAAANDIEEFDIKDGDYTSRRDKTIQVLIEHGASVNLCDNNGISPLFIASQNGHDSTVQLLLDKGADVNLCQENGCSPLFIASRNGHDSTVKLLLDKGADINLCTKTGCSPLLIASQEGHDSTVKRLLDKGADVNLCQENGCSPLFIASQQGHDSTIKLLLDKGADINLCEENGCSPLYIASQEGHDSTVKLLLDKGADINLCKKDGCSPLYMASQDGHDSTVQLLLDKGADINSCQENGCSPLFIASRNGHDSTVKLLLDKGADINLCTKTGCSPLLIASQEGHDSTVKLLLDKGADVNLCQENGCSPIFIASQQGHDSTVKLLLDKGADINSCQENGCSPLFIASQQGHDSTVKLLLDKGADVNLCQENGCSPLFIASRNGHDSSVKLLLDKGADINLCKKDGCSPLYIASQQGCDSTVQLLLDKGADINLCKENGCSPLYMASQDGHDGTVQLLLDKGADINSCQENGCSPLFIASQQGHDSTVQLLLDKGADVNLCQENGCSPLFIASRNGHDSTVKLLLDKGADINLCTKTGCSPLLIASQEGHDSTVKLLLDKGADVNLYEEDGCKDGCSPLFIASQQGHDSTVKLLLDKGADVNLCQGNGCSPLFIASQQGHDSTVKLLLDKGADIN
nr:uncharacterized protein LOC111100100 isoform X2 [Crassostrea virginica]XP_022287461.1 uncharacterized protein LOC111100100 isoform X2 [Crassostrea virginica]